MAKTAVNAVERIQYYAGGNLPQEAAYDLDPEPGTEWPSQGVISFEDAVMSYRKTLPPVLKGMYVAPNIALTG